MHRFLSNHPLNTPDPVFHLFPECPDFQLFPEAPACPDYPNYQEYQGTLILPPDLCFLLLHAPLVDHEDPSDQGVQQLRS